MASSQPPEQPPSRNDEKPAPSTSNASNTNSTQPVEGGGDKMDVTPDPPAETWSDLPEELLTASAEEIVTRRRLIENDIRVS
jgi:26S proteasome regulatory subunit T5